MNNETNHVTSQMHALCSSQVRSPQQAFVFLNTSKSRTCSLKTYSSSQFVALLFWSIKNTMHMWCRPRHSLLKDNVLSDLGGVCIGLTMYNKNKRQHTRLKRCQTHCAGTAQHSQIKNTNTHDKETQLMGLQQILPRHLQTAYFCQKRRRRSVRERYKKRPSN